MNHTDSDLRIIWKNQRNFNLIKPIAVVLKPLRCIRFEAQCNIWLLNVIIIYNYVNMVQLLVLYNTESNAF